MSEAFFFFSNHNLLNMCAFIAFRSILECKIFTFRFFHRFFITLPLQIHYIVHFVNTSSCIMVVELNVKDLDFLHLIRSYSYICVKHLCLDEDLLKTFL